MTSRIVVTLSAVALVQRATPVLLDATGARKAPSEFRIFPAGAFGATKGKYTFSARSAEKVMEAFKAHGTELAFDYEHQTFSDPPVRAPAAGWFTPEVRNGELWATQIKWTPDALKHIQDGEYRYFSPAFETEKGGEVVRLLNVALTNLPSMHSLQPLVAASQKTADRRTAVTLSAMSFDAIRMELEAALRALYPEGEGKPLPWLSELYDDHLIVAFDGHLYRIAYEVRGASAVLVGEPLEVQRTYTPVAKGDEGEPMKNVLTALALAATASEADATSAVVVLRDERDAAKRTAAAMEAELLTLTDSKSAGEAKGRIAAWKESAAQVATLSASLKAAEDKLAAHDAEAKSAKVLGMVEAGIKDGKIAPAQKEYFLSMGRKDVEMLSGYLGTAVPMVATAPIAKPAGGEDKHEVTLTDTEKKVAKKMGISEADFIATKKAHEKK